MKLAVGSYLRDSLRSRAISLIDLPWTKCSRRIRPIVSTTSIPHRPLRAKAGSRPSQESGGEFSTPKHTKGLLARVHPNVAVAALADKLARICGAVLRSRQDFPAKGAPVTA
jgi:hypothetical protein